MCANKHSLILNGLLVMMLASNGGMRALAEQQDSTQEEDLFALSLEDLVTLDFNLLYKVQEKLSFSLRVDILAKYLATECATDDESLAADLDAVTQGVCNH